MGGLNPTMAAEWIQAQMEGHEIKAGAIVRLKSGGPKMTVSSESVSPDLVSCNWFADAELKSSCFDREQLKPAE